MKNLSLAKSYLDKAHKRLKILPLLLSEDDYSDVVREAQEIYLKIMAPVTPHIAEELWSQFGKPYSIHQQQWPQVDEAAAKEDSIELPVQINGKVRDRIIVPAEATEEEVRAAALASEIVQKYLEGKEPRKVIVVKGKLVSLVV